MKPESEVKTFYKWLKNVLQLVLNTLKQSKMIKNHSKIVKNEKNVQNH